MPTISAINSTRRIVAGDRERRLNAAAPSGIAPGSGARIRRWQTSGYRHRAIPPCEYDPLARPRGDPCQGVDVHLMCDGDQHARPLPACENVTRARRCSWLRGAVSEEGVEAGFLQHLAGEGQFRRLPRPAPLGRKHLAHRNSACPESRPKGARLGPPPVVQVPLGGTIAEHEASRIAGAWCCRVAEKNDGAGLSQKPPGILLRARGGEGNTKGQEQEDAAFHHADCYVLRQEWFSRTCCAWESPPAVAGRPARARRSIP